MLKREDFQQVYNAACLLGPHIALKKIYLRLLRDISKKNRRRLDNKICSRGSLPDRSFLPSLIGVGDFDVSATTYKSLRVLLRNHCTHHFDLLGSGLKNVTARATIINQSNRDESKRIRALISQANYRPIDWHSDFKSGYRWDSTTHSYDIEIPMDQGVDVKVPWELARLQHLPQLALFGATYCNEIRDQILDFLAANPPRFGVNWVCSMDVAIRIANILLSVDMVQSQGYVWDTPFLLEVLRAAQNHSDHILNHLEWSEIGRTNHYISDIVGLLWANAYLPESSRRNAVLAFSAQEFIKESRVQFLDDGGCYEGSSNYHRLSGSLLSFGQAMLARLYADNPQIFENFTPNALRVRPPFSSTPTPCPNVTSLLRKAACLSRALTPSTGLPVQIGDSDGGHLFKIHPDGKVSSSLFYEQPLSHEGFISSVAALHGIVSDRLDAQLISRLIQRKYYPVPQGTSSLIFHGDLGKVCDNINALSENAQRRRDICLFEFAVDDLMTEAFPHFGSYVFRTANFYFHFRCAPKLNICTPTGHFHDDGLAIDMIAPNHTLRDPGSYLYTPDINQRNLYRSEMAHDNPRAETWDVAQPNENLFRLKIVGSSRCLAWQSNGVAGEIQTPHGKLWRAVIFKNGLVSILDGVSPPNNLRALSIPPDYCDNYGRKA